MTATHTYIIGNHAIGEQQLEFVEEAPSLAAELLSDNAVTAMSEPPMSIMAAESSSVAAIETRMVSLAEQGISEHTLMAILAEQAAELQGSGVVGEASQHAGTDGDITDSVIEDIVGGGDNTSEEEGM